MRDQVTYLASPYSHPNPAVREQRYKAACAAAARLMARGETVFSPIAHSHPIAMHLDPALVCDFRFWMAQDLPILAACSLLRVLRLDGWQESRGVGAEMRFAGMHGILTEFMDP